MNIELIHNDQIDRKLWDRQTAQSLRSSIFNFSWYLDVIDKDWYALVKGDYEWTLPFFSENKQIFMPYWLPYLSVSSSASLDEEEKQYIEQFWLKHYTNIKHSFSKYQFKFSDEQILKPKAFYQKDLINDYKILSFNFDENIHTQLDKAGALSLRTISFRSLYEYIEFSKIYCILNVEEINILRRIILKATQLNTGKMYAVYNAKNQIIAIAFILFFKHKAYIMHSAFSAEGLESKADYLLLNNLIKDLSLYNISLENHSKSLNDNILKQFGFDTYYSYEFHQNAKQNMLSLLLQFLKK